jgi:DNA invertase Pin-like site-specific DNA recombinase
MATKGAIPPTRRRAAVYCRISSDRTGEGLGVERQEQDSLALVKRKGWDLVARFVDNDVSAYSGRRRPGYEALLEAIRADQVDVVVAWHPDRLHRSPSELEAFIDLVEKRQVAVETVQAGLWDLSTPSGRMIARQLGVVARYESEHKSDRVRRAIEQRSNGGASHGRLSFGWTRTTQDGRRAEVLDEEQAEQVRLMAARLIAGHSLRQIAADLTTAGGSSPSGRPWTPQKVREILMRPRNAGLQVFRGEVTGEGAWPAILERGEWEQVRSVLSDPARRTTSGSAAKHLLSGMARCGVCGSKCYARTNNGTPVYTCHAKNCVARARHQVDAFVEALVLGRLARPDAVDLLKPRDDGAKKALAEAATLRGRLDTAADDYADGKIDGEQLRRITERLRPKLEALTAASRTVDDSPLLVELIEARDPRPIWDAMPVSARRAVVDLLLELRILPIGRGKGVDNRVMNPEHLDVKWRAS